MLTVTAYTLEKLEEHWRRESENKGAVKRNDSKNVIAAHTCKIQHKVDREAQTGGDKLHTQEDHIKAIHIRKRQQITSNLECGCFSAQCGNLSSAN